MGNEHPAGSRAILGRAADPNRRVAINALAGLCKAADAEARRKLVDLIHGDDHVSRRAAVWAMGKLGDPEFAEILAPLQNDPDENMRKMAMQSLALLRFPSAPPAAPAAAPRPRDAGSPVGRSGPQTLAI